MRLVIIHHYYFTNENDKVKFHFLMKTYHYTVASLAKEYGCSKSYMYSIITGKKPVHRDMLEFFKVVFDNHPLLYDLFDERNFF